MTFFLSFFLSKMTKMDLKFNKSANIFMSIENSRILEMLLESLDVFL